MGKQKKYDPEFKSQVVLSLLSGKMSMAQVCKKYTLRDSLVSRWKSQFLEKAPEIFQNGRNSRVEEQEEKIAELERMVGKLAMEKEILKKASNLLNSL